MSEEKSAAEKIKERLDIETSGSSSSESKKKSKSPDTGEDKEDTGPIDIADESEEEEEDEEEEPPKGSPQWKLKEGKPLAEAEKRKLQEQQEEKGISRRTFLNTAASFAGWVGFAGGVGTCAAATGRYMMPNVQFEPPQTFKAGFPAEYEVGSVETKYKAEQRAWIIRTDHDPFVEEAGFYAIYAKCTHLGCTPNWLSAQNIFKCPCHGSGYRKSGVNFEGPAPRPMERFRIYVGGDGQITVDKNTTFQQEKGEWTNPEAFLAASELS